MFGLINDFVAAVPHRAILLPDRAVSRLFPLLAVLLLAFGCPKPASPIVEPAPSLAGVTVKLSAPAELALAQQWQLQLEEWSASTGGEFVLQAAEMDASAPGPDATLAIVPLATIPDLIASDWIAPLSGDDSALAHWEDVVRGLRTGIARPGGEPHVVPIACPVLACYYRADLLEAAGRKPPQTWKEYQALLDDLSGWSGGLPALEPWTPSFRSTMFLARAASGALHPDNVSILLDLQSGNPLIGGPPFVQALNDSLAALKRLDPRSLESGPVDCVRAVLAGEAALAIGVAPDEASDSPRDPSVVIGTVRLPGATRVYEPTTGTWTTTPDGAPSRVTVVGFGGYAVCAARSAGPDVREAAWGLWDSVQRDSAEDELPFGPAVCRQRDAPVVLQQPRAGFHAGEWRQHIESTVGALQDTRVLLDFPLPERARFRERMTARLTEAIDGDAPAETALQQLADDWKALISELGDRRVLSVYRQCHGLSPR